MLRKILPLIYLLTLTFIFFFRPFDGNGDFYHHINAGKFVIENHELPLKDNLTFSRLNHEWVPYAWGSGVILYLIFNSFGYWGVSFWVAAMAFLTLSLLFLILRSLKVSPNISLLTATLVCLPMAIRWPARPELVTYPFVLLILLIEQYRNKFPRISLLLPVIIIFWANLYGSSVLFGLILIVFLITKQLWVSKLKNLSREKIFLTAAIISLPASLLNGIGLKSTFYIFFIPKVASYEGEWAGIMGILANAPLSYLIATQYLLIAYFIFLTFYIFILILSFKKILPNLYLFILSLVIFAPIIAFRHTPLAAILAAPFIGILIQGSKGITRRIIVVASIITCIISVFLFTWLRPINFTVNNEPINNLTNFIRQNDLRGNVFNYQTVGGYLSYHFHPKILVFYDTRDDLFVNSEVFDDLYSTLSNQASVIPLLDKYRADYVVGDLFTDTLNYRGLFNSPDWKIVYFNDRYFVAARSNIAAKHKLPDLSFINPYSESMSKPGQEKEAEDYFTKIAKGSPTFTNNSYLISTLIAQNKYKMAQKVARSLTPDQGATTPLFQKNIDNILATTFLEQKDCANTSYYIERLKKEVNNKIIFHADRKIPSSLDKLLAFYYLVCKKDLFMAESHLEIFFSENFLTPLEKAKIQQKFDNLKLKYAE